MSPVRGSSPLTVAQSPRIASSDPLLLSTLSSFCCAGWLLLVTLPLLLASLPSLCPCQRPCCTGVLAIVALASLPTITAATAVDHAAVKCSRQSPSLPATATVELHLPLAIASPSSIAAAKPCHAATAIKRPRHHHPLRRRRPPLPPGRHLHHHHHHRCCHTHCCPLPKKEATAAPPPVYQWQHQRENVYKS